MNNVDTHNLLTSKENIQPLRQGRDTSKLYAALEAQSNKEMQQLLEKQRNEFEIRLRSNNGDDPLSDWCDYIHWIEQSFLKKPHEGKLNTILQKCLNKFKDNERYKNDIRFVKLCIKYADMEENTVELLSQIHRHGIGVSCSELYIAWAEKYAINSCFKKANMIYEKGLQNQAKPLELLKAAHQNFHAFLVRKMLNEKEEFKPTFLEELNKEIRQPYNVLKTINSGQNDIVSNVRIGANVKGSPGKLKMNNALEKKPKSNISIKIFEDNDESVAVEPSARLQKIQNKKISSKENTIKPGPWTKNDTKKTSFSTSLASNVPFQVHRDEDECEAIGRLPSVSSSVLKSRSKKDNEAPALISRQLFYPEPYNPTKIVMYCKDQVYAGGLEFQFEELRAIEYRRRELERDNVINVVQNLDVQSPNNEHTDIDLFNTKSIETNKKNDTHYLWCPEKNNSDPLEVNVFCEQKTEHQTSDKSKTDRRKTFILEPIHKDRILNNKCLTEEVLPTTEYSINQTIHTKEALSEMQQLWFSKPASPLLEDNAGSKHSDKPILKSARPCFNLYVDESCMENFINTDKPDGPLDLTFKCSKDSESLAHQSADKLKKLIHDPKLKERNLGKNQQSLDPLTETDDANKENDVPEDYCGSIGKSTRKVSGILTPAENIPIAPLSDEGNEEDEEEEQVLGVPQCNVTGVTENLTKVFQFPRNESTPNPRKSLQYKQELNKSLFEGELNGNQNLEMECKPIETLNEFDNKIDVPAESDLASIKSPSGRENCLKNLSMIAETSREYKSSSSGSSGVSTFQIRSFKSHPRNSIDVRAASSNMTVSQSVLHKTKGQSLTGYEASAESSQTGLKSSGLIDEKLAIIEGDSALNVCKSQQQQQQNDGEEKEENLKTSEPTNICLKDIDPFSENVIDELLKSVRFCGDKYTNYINENSPLNMPKVGATITLDNSTYDIKKILGEGSYARVYDLTHSTTGRHIVAKIQKPAFPWEFYIIEELHCRIKEKEKAESFMRVESAHFFTNASVLVTEPVEFGNLLDTINILKQNQLLNHLIAVYFTIEILRILETLHSCQIIHADIKPDNFLVMNRNDKPRLQLIDFGRAIDMTLLPKGTTFTQVIKTEGFTTTEMKKGKPWTYQVDFYGAANSSHCLLFGDYMKVTEKNGIWNITKIIPRYWARNEWKNYFSTLLNIKSCLNIPDIPTLINPFEAILKDNKEFDFILNRLNNILRNQ